MRAFVRLRPRVGFAGGAFEDQVRDLLGSLFRHPAQESIVWSKQQFGGDNYFQEYQAPKGENVGLSQGMSAARMCVMSPRLLLVSSPVPAMA